MNKLVSVFSIPVIVSLAVFLLFNSAENARAEDGTQAVSLKSAWGLYTQKKYVDSAQAFEILLKKHRPSARLYYYAALANFSANRRTRARQLSAYIVKHFGTSTEAVHARKMFPELASSATKNNAESVNSVQSEKKPSKEELKIRIAKLKAILKKKASGRKLTKKELAYIAAGESKKTKKKFFTAKNFRRGERPFTAAHIAKDGANGIDQGVNPNCWFEASISALAELPRGQRLIASMIRYGSQKDSYVVRFPGDGVEYKITAAELKKRNIRDRALWASLLSCAQVMKFPNNRGANGPSGNDSRLAVGLGCVTGCRAQVIMPGKANEQQLSSFIGSAISSKNPVVCGTWGDSTLSRYPSLVIGAHAYTITGFNPATKMITIRNPHGSGSRKFSPDRNTKRKYEHLGDGSFKMHLSLFRNYFSQVCRSFI